MLGSVASFHIIIYRDGPIPKCKINLQCSMKFLLKLPAGMISCLFNLLTALVFLALRFGHSWACLRPSLDQTVAGPGTVFFIVPSTAGVPCSETRKCSSRSVLELVAGTVQGPILPSLQVQPACLFPGW